MSKLLGIDYGDKRIGLAMAETESLAVAPFKTLINDKKLITNLQKIIQDEDITKVVVGWPVNLKNQKTEQTKKVERFLEIIMKELARPVVTEDERFTTKIFQKTKVKNLDALSAMKILESYLSRSQ